MTSCAISAPQLNLLLLLCGEWTKLWLELEFCGCCFSAAAAGEGGEEFIQQGPTMLVVPVQVTPKPSCFWANQCSCSGKQRAAWGMRPSFPDSLFSLLWGGGKVSRAEWPLRWGAFGWQCLDVESRSTLVHSGFLLDWLAVGAWTVGAVWRTAALGRILFLWQLLLGLTEEQWCLGVRNIFFFF